MCVQATRREKDALLLEQHAKKKETEADSMGALVRQNYSKRTHSISREHILLHSMGALVRQVEGLRRVAQGWIYDDDDVLGATRAGFDPVTLARLSMHECMLTCV